MPSGAHPVHTWSSGPGSGDARPAGCGSRGNVRRSCPAHPVEVTHQAVTYARSVAADSVLAMGGGSTIGLGKAIAVRTGLPQLALPTTYAGSEMTPILGETEGRRKTTRRLPEALLRTVVYDVDLTLTLPAAISVVSGINAMAHAVEALYAQDRDPVAFLMAGEALDSLTRSLPVIARRPDDGEARADALYGAWLAGTCLGTVGMALHHKVCHVLGGTFGLPHAETHTVVLPHVVAYNGLAAPKPWHASRRRCRRTTPRAVSSTSPGGSVPPGHCETSACPNRGSSRRPNSSCGTATGIRAQSTGQLSAPS